MKNIIKGMLTVLFVISFSVPARLQDAGNSPDEGKIVKELLPSLVTVMHPRGSGSGFIIDGKGYILTNYHVVAQPTFENPVDVSKRIVVQLHNERKYPATVVGSDAEFDIALLKIETEEQLSVMGLADSDKVTRGEKCIALGNPLNVRETATYGAISNPRRARQNIANYMQTDAPLNPGNSGGPLVDMDGKVIGINSSVLPGEHGQEGIGFAIPINTVKIFMDKWLAGEKITKSSFGVMVTSVGVELANRYNIDKGIAVGCVFEGSAAEKAGIKPKDIIVEFDGVQIELAKTREDINDFIFRLMIAPIGKKVIVKAVRPSESTKETKNFELAMEERPLSNFELKRKSYDETGLIIQDISLPDYYTGAVPSPKGVKVLMVVNSSPAQKAGIMGNDIIVEAEGKTIDNAEMFDKAIMPLIASNKDKVLVKVLRRKDELNLVLDIQYILKGKTVLAFVPKNYDTKISDIIKNILLYNGANYREVNNKEEMQNAMKSGFDAVVFLSGDLEDFTNDQVYSLIKEAVKDKKVLAAIDNASLLFALSGDEELKKKKMTTSLENEKKMREAGISSTNQELEVDGNTVTAISKDDDVIKAFARAVLRLTARK